MGCFSFNREQWYLNSGSWLLTSLPERIGLSFAALLYDKKTRKTGKTIMIELNFSKETGLLPAIAQDAQTNEILMLAYINEEAWRETLATGRATYYSRSRKKLWRKGEESGNVQLIRAIYLDCDLDAVIFKVEQIGGAACHTGHRSCFYRRLDGDSLVEEGELIFDPVQVYHK